VDANENYNGTNDNEDYDINADFDVCSTEDDLHYKIKMSYKMVSRNKKNCGIKKLEIKLEGYFDLDEGTPEKLVAQMVPFNCIFMLYGVMRGIVINTTASSPGGPMLLPVINFNDMIKKNIDKKPSRMKRSSKLS
jgi:preprotein translocase subunit SecB